MLRFLAAWLALAVAASPVTAQTTPFASLVDSLSEGEGFFDSDNLVSNESSYLHVIGTLRAAGVRRGGYIGVGPEQNFSYIAAIEPEIAYIIDIRRDNMLLHLLLKAMFEAARNRVEYLALLYGRPAPSDANSWRSRDLTTVLDYFMVTPMDSAGHARSHAALMERVTAFGVPLTAEDRSTLRRFHDEFAGRGLALTFTSLGRISRRNYPTAYRLYAEMDLDSTQQSYLSTEQRWQVVRALQLRDRVIPVVGDLAGPRALRAISRHLAASNRAVSAFYISNVEMYLFRNGVFGAFVENVRTLPATRTSTLIRSWFGGFNRFEGVQPAIQPGHISMQQTQSFADFVALTSRPDSVSYWMLLKPERP